MNIFRLRVNPLAVATMKEDSIDISGQTSNKVNEYRYLDFDFIITVCDHARDRCPYFSSAAQRFHYNFPDPAKVTGTQEEILEAFREVRTLIKNYCADFVNNNFSVVEKM